MGKIRVLVASDYEMVRSGLRQLLKIDEAFDLLPIDAISETVCPTFVRRSHPTF